jgi:hypothetical protein
VGGTLLLAGVLAWAGANAAGETVRVDPSGCGRAVRDGVALRGAEPFCVERWFTARLEDPGVVHAVLLVRPRDPGTEGEWPRVFVYRLDGTWLAPRFLSSGFPTLRVRDAGPAPGGRLRVVVDGGQERGRVLTCGFVGFPLACGWEGS